MIDLEGSLRVWHDQFHRPDGMQKTDDDLKRYDAILSVAPLNTLLIETGSANGASALWFANHGINVVSIDRRSPQVRSDWVTFVQADSGAGPSELTRAMAAQAAAIYVVLDSDHSREHVLRELEVWSPLVTPGAYLVVEDTITVYLSDYGGYDGSPAEAVLEWLPHHPEFIVDNELEDMFPTTQCPGGWLRRQ